MLGGAEKLGADLSTWEQAVNERPPSIRLGLLTTDFQPTVFWERNKALHQGKATHTRDSAAASQLLKESLVAAIEFNEKGRARSTEVNTK